MESRVAVVIGSGFSNGSESLAKSLVADLTAQGFNVISPLYQDDLNEETLPDDDTLIAQYMRAVDIADEVFIVVKDNYVGRGTMAVAQYAISECMKVQGINWKFYA